MTERGFGIDWTAERWRRMLGDFGRATKLSLQLFGPDGNLLLGPVHPTPLFPFFTAAAADLIPSCVHRCLSASVADSIVVESREGIGACAAAIRDDDERICAMVVAAYALTTHLSVLQVRRLTARSDRPFNDVWPLIRTTIPTTVDQLKLYAALLSNLVQSVLAEHVSAHAAAVARHEAEAASRAKDEFLAMLAHELRNPLSAVRNAIATASLDETRRPRALEIARRQAEQLTRLLEDLLDVARITQDRITLRKEHVFLANILQDAVDSMRSFIESRRVELTVNLTTEPIRVDGDPARLEQVVVNLLSNAAKYTEAGGRIDLTTERHSAEVIIRIRDSGIGIAPEMLPRLWDLFSQAKQALDRAPGGLGIGLTIARRLIELHGGRIEAHSEGLGKGAEFVVTLTALATSEEIPPTPPAESIAYRTAHVLLIEDNPDTAESLTMLLELLGHRVRTCSDGVTALDAARMSVPDVMLVDIGLPGIDGYEVARRVRQDPAFKGVVLVALTGYGSEEDKQHAMAVGFDYHLVKPVNPDMLYDLVARLAHDPDEQTTLH